MATSSGNPRRTAAISSLKALITSTTLAAVIGGWAIMTLTPTQSATTAQATTTTQTVTSSSALSSTQTQALARTHSSR